MRWVRRMEARVTAAKISRALDGHRSGNSYIARCPAHEDKNPSLSLRDADGKVLVHCHAGCDQRAVIDALRALGLWPDSMRLNAPKRYREPVATYDYTDEEGRLLYQICRYAQPKEFRQRYPDGRGGWIWRKHPHQVLYRLPEVLEAGTVFVVEGERDVETLRSYGFVATTNAGGANAKWQPEFTDALRGRAVILIPDRDSVGYERVSNIARALLGSVARLVYVELEDGKDLTEWFERGHSEVELLALLDNQEVTK